eukprot:12200242-Alexandrium_andersonii.AAC.1
MVERALAAPLRQRAAGGPGRAALLRHRSRRGAAASCLRAHPRPALGLPPEREAHPGGGRGGPELTWEGAM